MEGIEHMNSISIQDRYDEVSKISGLSEDIIRRVYKATRTSMINSLKRGERATLPGICTITPEIRNRIDYGAESMTSYIKLKANVSSALDNELSRSETFLDIKKKDERLSNEEAGMQRLNIIDSKDYNIYSPHTDGIRTRQIAALL